MKAFFKAAEEGDWVSVSNKFKAFLRTDERRDGVIHDVQNELWSPILETLGICDVWVGWKKDSALLKLLYDPIMSSMPKGSIYFGGTDHGRFVITTVNALQEPPPVFCMTQNAFADNRYLSYLRAVYGKDLWIPDQKESNMAFKRYFDEVRSGTRPTSAEIKVENDGRVTVSGVSGVMAINGILCQMIFEHNKDSHEFFVEESYVLNWMYPYLEPHGLIMKLNRQPSDKFSEDTVARDRKFWNRYIGLLEKRPGFTGNVEARKAFSKMRSEIAGLYVYRKMYEEAEAAFRQAIRLCRISSESSDRLAKMYEEQGRMAEAIEVMTAYLKCDSPDSKDKAEEYLKQLKNRIKNGTEPIR
ncbi:MAG: tetratricopeptide repeat protein [Lentisphaerae bacterium]|nr:tetratricopeptide repeat protein [Lentisphaerota bacterium]